MQSQVKFNRVPEKVPDKVPEPGEVQQDSGRFRRGSGEGLGGLFGVQSQVRFKRVPEKVPGGFGAELGEVQEGSGEGSGEGLGGFGAEPGKVQYGFGEGSGEGLGGFGAEPTGFRRRFRRKFQETLVQSQVRFNRFRRCRDS